MKQLKEVLKKFFKQHHVIQKGVLPELIGSSRSKGQKHSSPQIISLAIISLATQIHERG